MASMTSAASVVPVSNSMPVYIPSRFSRMTTRSMSSKTLCTPLSDLPGRRLAYSPNACRNPTLTLRNPLPMGVVIGPLSPTVLRLSEASVSSGQYVALALQRRHARLAHVPLDAHAGRVKDTAGGARDFGTDPVAGNERHQIGHVCFAPLAFTLCGRGIVAPTRGDGC